MRRAVPALLLTAAGFFFVWQYQPQPDMVTETAAPPAVVSTAPGSTTKTVAGTTQRNRYGNVQVQVTFTDNRITAVEFLQLPRSGPSQEVAPTLVQETLRAQNANIDTVSGATQTSESYIRSLQAAIDAKGA
ncbi:FMN-binding protein [Actinocrispum wychmicini]|uniref:Uncharacterized protein with FMN-binding domain n=1 Tax=Actinocrispum wychmicini TaxID=1213861 RepID=A0A4R2IY66_9PSEU|nr:FMN-binding protein [Actinocrispum wychmicini]TCO50763.1 uncharacterized protein with FMN-binding domain [Actinocrispum wychmicini]